MKGERTTTNIHADKGNVLGVKGWKHFDGVADKIICDVHLLLSNYRVCPGDKYKDKENINTHL